MREYVLVCLVVTVVTFLATPFARWIAVRFDAITPVRGRDVHTVPIPRLGGLAMLAGLVAGLAVASQLPFLSQLFRVEDGQGPKLAGVLVGAVLICALGVIDDLRGLDALTKFAGQMLAGGLMAFSGVQLISLPIDGRTILPQPILVVLTVFIVVATTNAVNFVDGLDGLAAGVVGIAGLTFFIWAYFQPRFDPPNVFSVAALLSAVLVGCCLGFLPHNFFPARLFMGDSGALLLGLLLSAATISFTGDYDPAIAEVSTAVSWWLPIALPVAILLLPVVDILLAFRRRGRNFTRPDAKHLHHKMLRIGHTHRRAVLILYAWSFSIAVGVLSFSYTAVPVATSILAVLLAGSLVLTWGVPRWLDQHRL
ncbi:UDP-GlcNAc:undecaprenyl-phosphate GlcNAc-1-phosphate transferase [Barrientosiimonas humi]|uniref:UDP-GlcNAc:undecaprenyl-phosphate GlcNAc-1-phosphate transferase n=1 Tax=Barrientosiimonas humi TaxID=999931 RepID=A0A542X9F5_9MICO|nr:MraY family glycosyltransferase [Barrientosiimonas humi]TQL32471.1 UDP-GlcNAc:undecaprenyl-phosphate GlcNAc-1-phosphate transferase [Barrientosiimonas humi]CAG7572462.1 Decaprenyl-phosphate N-acetylglucosaminephosphotransferase [Barrientosiimonas humi]